MRQILESMREPYATSSELTGDAGDALVGLQYPDESYSSYLTIMRLRHLLMGLADNPLKATLYAPLQWNADGITTYETSASTSVNGTEFHISWESNRRWPGFHGFVNGRPITLNNPELAHILLGNLVDAFASIIARHSGPFCCQCGEQAELECSDCCISLCSQCTYYDGEDTPFCHELGESCDSTSREYDTVSGTRLNQVNQGDADENRTYNWDNLHELP